MASSSETGHAKNIGNAKQLNDINAGFGTAYNPSNALLVNATMVTQQAGALAKHNAANAAAGVFKPLVNARQEAYEPSKKLARRVRSAVKVCGAGKKFYDDVDTIVKKILGERASKPKPTDTDPAGTSASQQSFDNVADHWDKLVALLGNEPLYDPNETDLTVASLTTFQGGLVSANDTVKSGAVTFNNVLIVRDKALYQPTTGLVDVCQASKDYVRSVFGYSSPQFKLVSPLKFTRPKSK